MLPSPTCCFPSDSHGTTSVSFWERPVCKYIQNRDDWKTEAGNVDRSQWGFDCIVAGPDCGSKGVAILFRKKIGYKIHNILKDDERRYILIDMELFNKRLTLANVYVPSSGDHPEFFGKVIKEVVSMENELIVIGGDWNIALNPTIDTNQPSKVCRKKIIEFMHDYVLVDIYRTLHSDSRKYSWRRFYSTQRSRLDYFLVFYLFCLEIVSSVIMPGYCSDHSLVRIGFKTGIVKRHRPLWKFNNSLLRDKVFVNLVKQVISDLKKQYAVPIIYVW